MRFVRPTVFLTAKSKPNPDDCDEETADKYSYGSDHKTAGEKIIELAGRRCYMSFVPGLNPNVTRIREDIEKYIGNIFASKHGSVLEHVYFTFAIEGVSRVFTGEMNRHRAGTAISEGSMRFIRFTDIPFCETPMLRLTEEEQNNPQLKEYSRGSFENIADLRSLAVKKQRTRDLFEKSTVQDEINYGEFCEIWAEELAPESKFKFKKDITSLGRRGIPMGVGTGGQWTFNVRALRHMLTMRCDEPAEEEICVVGGLMLEKMMKEEPILFGDFKMNENGFWRPMHYKV